MQNSEEDDDEVDQKTQWFVEMLPKTQEQHQPVFRWAVDAERDRRRCSEEVEESVTEETRVQSTTSGLEEVTTGRVKRVSFREEEQPEGTRAQSIMSGRGGMTTGRGRTSPIQGGMRERSWN